ncbi:MAG: hypothetical protein IJJ99_05770 [Oscillospiraceae bacterium]|nr:hypothetical protein [Oscillospiraceae bacterium]
MNINDMENLMSILSVIALVVEALLLVQYVLCSLSLYTVAKRRAIPSPWYAWLPVIRAWTLGAICDQYDETRGFRRKWRTVLLTVTAAATAVFLLVSLVALALTVEFINPPEYLSYEETLTAALESSGGFYFLLIVMLVAASALNACQMICTFKFFESCRPNDTMKYLLLSLLVPFAQPICLMCCRDYDLGMQPSDKGERELPPHRP